MLFVTAGSATSDPFRGGWGSTRTLVYEDVEAIRREASAVRAVSAAVFGDAQIIYGNQNWQSCAGAGGAAKSVRRTRPEWRRSFWSKRWC